MEDNLTYLNNYKPHVVYTRKTKNGNGKYINCIVEGEELIGELQITKTLKIALIVFYHDKMQNTKSYKIKKFNDKKTLHELTLSECDVRKIYLFNQLFLKLNLHNIADSKIPFGIQSGTDNVSQGIDEVQFSEYIELVKKDPRLTKDIFALSNKKTALTQFEQLLIEVPNCEKTWQNFFQENSWIFGHGLNYIFLDKVHDKLEQVTTGYNHINSGKRTDALMKTKAFISQYVLIEIKTPGTLLLAKDQYRSGCWPCSVELTGAVSQAQKTAFEFVRQQPTIKDQIKDDKGNNTGIEIFKIMPKSYLICGNLEQLEGNDDKLKSFEIYRNSLNSPEILTFDELFERAKCIIETLSHHQN